MVPVTPKSPVKTPAIVPMRAQPHGGALRSGGTNRGGPGRPPSAVRETARTLYDERLPILAAIADDSSMRPTDRIQAVHELGRVGMGTAVSMEDVRERIVRQLEAVRDWGLHEGISPECIRSLVLAMQDVWS